MSEMNTETILSYDADTDDAQIIRPTLFVCYGRSISEYRLQGRQIMGRPSGDNIPDIPVHARFMSRDHGYFETDGFKTNYTAVETTNGIKYKGVMVDPGAEIQLKDGDELIIPWTDEEGRDRTVILVYACTVARIRLWRDLMKASRDKLTDLADRECFTSWWEQNKDKRDYAEAFLFILDVDDFKQLNDTSGHNVGDMALKIIAQELRDAVRYDNQVCRWGGDEFAGIIPSSEIEAGKRFRELSGTIGAASADAGISLSVSIGYVDIRAVKDRGDITSLVELADKALYSIKRSGKGGIAQYQDSIDTV
ncbi:MAG: GGDEF domain-containing protein [Lachnospiraceae bacterium]|nr:GGDEF domain-containing protein [Lachnospiraceae bacterium]